MNNIYIIIFLFSFNIFSQELSIKLNDNFFFKNSVLKKDILLKNDTSIFVIPGIYNFYNDSTDFVIYYDGKKDYSLSLLNNNISFNGISDFDFKFLNRFFSYYNSLIKDISMSNMSPDQYEIFMYDVKKKMFSFLKKEEYDFSLLHEDVSTLLINYIDFAYYNSLCDYIIESGSSEEVFSYKLIPYFLDEKFYFNAANKNFNFLLFDQYLYNMTKLLSYKNSLNTKNQNIRVLFSSFFQFGKKHLNQESLNFCVMQFILDYANHIEEGFFNEIINLLHGISERKRAWINYQYNIRNQDQEKTFENIFIVKKHDFYLESDSGHEVSLDDFLGKVLYIDIWASWCGPCRKLFPFSKDLKSKFKKKQLKKIDFIYVSIDNDYDKWKKSIEVLGIDGKNFISPSNKNNGIGQYFQVSSIPRYIIIDKSGNIIEGNAKRPNDESIFNDLLELINE